MRAARRAVDIYGIRSARVRLVAQRHNIVFAVVSSAGDRYALRMARPSYRSIPELEAEAAWLSELSSDGSLVVPEPVPTVRGPYTATVEQGGCFRNFLLFRWVKGRRAQRITVPAAAAVGALLAHLHHRAERSSRPPEFERPIYDLRGVTGAAIGADPQVARSKLRAEDLAVLDDAAARVGECLGRIDRLPQTWGLVHGDLTLGNLVFDKGAPRPIDFDDLGWGYYGYDVAATYLALPRGSPGVRQAFLQEYRRVREVSWCEAEFRSFVAARHIYSILWWAAHYLKSSSTSEGDEATEWRINVLREFAST